MEGIILNSLGGRGYSWRRSGMRRRNLAQLGASHKQGSNSNSLSPVRRGPSIVDPAMVQPQTFSALPVGSCRRYCKSNAGFDQLVAPCAPRTRYIRPPFPSHFMTHLARPSQTHAFPASAIILAEAPRVSGIPTVDRPASYCFWDSVGVNGDPPSRFGHPPCRQKGRRPFRN